MFFNYLNRILGYIILGQSNPENELLLRSEKIYSVLTILLVIFGVLIAYLVISQSRIRKLEKKIEEIDHQESL
jgi:uncharacterized membrane protein